MLLSRRHVLRQITVAAARWRHRRHARTTRRTDQPLHALPAWALFLQLHKIPNGQEAFASDERLLVLGIFGDDPSERTLTHQRQDGQAEACGKTFHGAEPPAAICCLSFVETNDLTQILRTLKTPASDHRKAEGFLQAAKINLVAEKMRPRRRLALKSSGRRRGGLEARRPTAEIALRIKS
jgi:hypothetical protein